MDEQQFLVIRDSSDIDVLDENLYCYETILFTLTPDIQKRTSDNLLKKVERFIDSVPAIQKAANKLKKKTEFIPRLDLLPEEVKQALQNGTAEMMPCKADTNAIFLKIRDITSKKVIKEIPLGTNTVPTDITGAMQCLSMQNQLNQIAAGLKEISEACEFNFGRIIQGQRDDRLAKLLSSRSCFIQALAMSDEMLQKQMLLQSIRDANSARAELALQIKSDINLLGGEKTLKSKDMENIVRDINIAVIALNNAVQLSLYSYQAIGEHNAQLAIIKEHETFIKQILLKEIEYKESKQIAWNIICSSGKSGSTPQDFRSLPEKLINNCVVFIENKNDNITYRLEDKFDE